MTTARSASDSSSNFSLDSVKEKVARDAGATRIKSITTVRSALQPNVTHVLVMDSDGLTGVGETFYGASVVEAHVHDVMAPALKADKPLADEYAVALSVAGY